MTKSAFVILPDRRGDSVKRTCKYYAACPDFKDAWEDERGCQMECKICGATLWVDAATLNEKS